jgi:hypothetical protein
MGLLFGRSILIEGLFAGVLYRSLRIMHEWAVGGTAYALLSFVARAWFIAPLHQ